MKYTLDLDEKNFVISVSNTVNDDFELDLDSLDLHYLHAYKKVDDKLILDKDKKAEIDKQDEQKIIDDEILDLQNKLTSTDYIMSRMLEEIMVLDKPLTFIADMIKVFISYANKYKEQLANRKSWRKRIEELRNGK